MKAITIWQPWAQLAAEGKKHDETRSWATRYRGPILIHAAKKSFYECVRLLPMEAQARLKEIYEPDGDRRLRVDAVGYLDRHFTTGAIIGAAILRDCKLIDPSYNEFVKNLCPAEYAFGDFTVGRYAWVLEEPVLFSNPVPASGRQGLWEYKEPIQEVAEWLRRKTEGI